MTEPEVAITLVVPKGRSIFLPFADRDDAFVIGGRRQMSSWLRNAPDKNFHSDDVEEVKDATNLGQHVIGAMAECAFAKLTRLKWRRGVDDWGHPDVEPDWEVRWHSSMLRIREKDVLTRRFALVIGQPPIFSFRGWIYGYEVTTHNEWYTPKSARGAAYWLVPQRFLRDYVGPLWLPQSKANGQIEYNWVG